MRKLNVAWTLSKKDLLKPCDRKAYGQKLREAAEKLGVCVRSVQRLVKAWAKEGLAGITCDGRSDKGQHRISEFWLSFIAKTYNENNKGSKRMSPKQVEMLIIDEADRLSPETFADVRDFYDKLAIAVVLVGTDRLDAVVKRDEQVFNRFRGCYRFGKLSGKDFEKTVKVWEQQVLKLLVASNLTSKEMLNILTTATGGYIGRLDAILREAAMRSLSKDFKKVDKVILQQVAKEYK